MKEFDETRVEVKVNDDIVRAPRWARWRDAVTAWRPDAGIALSAGQAWLTDPRGEVVDPDGRVVNGAAIRIRFRGEEK